MLDASFTAPSLAAQIAAAPARSRPRPRLAAEAGQKPARAPAHDVRSLWEVAWSEARTPSPSSSLSALRASVPMKRGAGLFELRDRVIRAAREMRETRWDGTQGDPARDLQKRLTAHIVAKARREVAARGGETDIDGVELDLLDRDPAAGLVLVGCDGWRQYSRAYGRRFASLRYLYGADDNGAFAVRVPGSVDTVAAAIEAITPAEVRRAHEAGRGVLRQGDVYALELKTSRVSDDVLWGTHHRYDPERRRLVHEDADAPHRDVVIPASWRGVKFVFQGGLGMGRLQSARGRGLED